MALRPISFAPSANIADIWHDSDTQTLIVRFKWGGRLYKYSAVPESTAAGFSQSLSANDYLQRFIIPEHGSGAPIGSISAASDTGQGEVDISALAALLGEASPKTGERAAETPVETSSEAGPDNPTEFPT
jgi:hypothetical protein